jgi:hypothetical protein
MAGSLTVPIYRNVRKRPALCQAAVRLKRAFKCDFRQPFSRNLLMSANSSPNHIHHRNTQLNDRPSPSKSRSLAPKNPD